MLKQSDSQIIFWFMHDVVATYDNSGLFFMFKTYEKPINIYFFDTNIGLGHMHIIIMPTMTTVGTNCILIISSFKNLTVKHQTKTTINHQIMF